MGRARERRGGVGTHDLLLLSFPKASRKEYPLRDSHRRKIWIKTPKETSLRVIQALFNPEEIPLKNVNKLNYQPLLRKRTRASRPDLSYQRKDENKSSFLLTSYKPSARAVLGNIGQRSWQYGPSAARSVQKTIEGQYSPVQCGSS